jgi:hypothetical protein
MGQQGLDSKIFVPDHQLVEARDRILKDLEDYNYDPIDEDLEEAERIVKKKFKK